MMLINRAAAKIVLELLSIDEKQHRIYVFEELLNVFNDNPDIYDIETKT